MVSHISSATATWSCLILLLSIHLAMNHAAVRSVSMRTLNRQRANIVLSHLIDDNKVLTPQQVSQLERVFEWDGILRWKGSMTVEGKAHIGVTLQTLICNLTHTQAHSRTGAIRDVDFHLQRLVEMYKDEDFLFWCDRAQRMGYIILKDSATPGTQLKAWAVALWVSHRLNIRHVTKTHPHPDPHATIRAAATPTNEVDATFETMQQILHDLTDRWDEWTHQLEAAGWDIQVASLETQSGTRIQQQQRQHSSVEKTKT